MIEDALAKLPELGVWQKRFVMTLFNRPLLATFSANSALGPTRPKINQAFNALSFGLVEP